MNIYIIYDRDWVLPVRKTSAKAESSDVYALGCPNLRHARRKVMAYTAPPTPFDLQFGDPSHGIHCTRHKCH